MSEEVLRRVDALIQVGMRLARSAPSGRILLAQLARVVDPVWIPRPWGDAIGAELERAAGAVPEPIDFRRVERALGEQWGKRAADELDDLEREPVAVTPTSQVHRGVLDGNLVAVKLRRGDLASSLRQDLALLEGLLAPLAAAFPKLNAAAILREVRERAFDELDLEHEALMQRRFHRALREHEFLSVPAPIMALAREGVLVSRWVEGVRLPDAPERDRACSRLVRFTLGALTAGLVHADPDADDVLVLDDGRLAILDFGAAAGVDRSRVQLAAGALEAFDRDDARALADSLERLGWLPAEHASTALGLARHALGELADGDPVHLDSEAVVEARDRLLEREVQLTELIVAGAILPEDLWPLRAAAQLFAVIARLGATGAWSEIARRALTNGWRT